MFSFLGVAVAERVACVKPCSGRTRDANNLPASNLALADHGSNGLHTGMRTTNSLALRPSFSYDPITPLTARSYR